MIVQISVTHKSELPAGLGQIGIVLAQHYSTSSVGRWPNIRSNSNGDSRNDPALPVFTGLLSDVTRSREQLLMENALLRQQLIVASRRVNVLFSGPMSVVS